MTQLQALLHSEVLLADGYGSASEERAVIVRPTNPAALVINPPGLGLEDYFTYESTDTGADTAAHVNVANGNMVWHSTPVVNPGRGLSSVVNLTYNSQDQGGYVGTMFDTAGPGIGGTWGDLAGVAYGEAGMGFSLGISGITRLNEPLGGVSAQSGAPTQVRLTDADGTRHVFTRSATTANTATYTPPPGVELALRYDSTGAADRRWAATRPDGVTHYFDADGYQTYITDRNDNTVRFEYERYSKQTGSVSDCTGSPAPSLLCAKHVVRVVDPAGVDAEPTPANPQGATAAGRSLKITYTSSPLPTLGSGYAGPYDGLNGPVGGTPGRIKRIVDHARRVTDFTYDQNGYLTTLTQGEVLAAGGGSSDTSDVRTTQFGYTGSGPNRLLTSVTDPRANTTTIGYQPVVAAAPGAQNVPRRALSVTNRRNNTTAFAYNGANTTVTKPGPVNTVYETDTAGRVQQITDARNSVSELDWSSDNYITRYAVAAGTADEAETELTYTRLGDTLTVTDPLDRVTTFTYRWGNETGPTNSGVDDGTQYVSDLISMRRPNRADVGLFPAPTVTFGLDTQGNVTSRTYAGKQPATVQYLANGLVNYEFDEVGNKTSYSSYDANGDPQTIVDPRGNTGSNGTWRYRYDAVGNLLTLTDPRGTATTAGSPYTSAFTYDAFDRVKTSQSPRCSDPVQTYANLCESGERFINRSFTYDDNGNPLASTDAMNATTTRTFNAMDEVASESAPPVAHYGESNAAAEVVRFDYDARENRVQVVSPRGSATATDGDYTTVMTYDALDRVVRQTAQGLAGTEDDLITSYAYDSRDNLVGLADPRANATGDPADNATNPAKQRWSYAYDPADNQVQAIEDPDSLELTTETSYDANDNVSAVTPPRGMEAAAGADRARFMTEYRYDIRDAVVSVRNGGTAAFPTGSRETRYERDQAGRVENVISPKGVASTGNGSDYITHFVYDPNGDLEELWLPRRDPSSAASVAKVMYTRNPVGDPTTIADPRGRDIVSTFYDTGDLLRTNRPSWFKTDGTSITERSADEWERFDGGEIPKTSGSGDYGSVNGVDMPDLLPKAGRAAFSYDREMRLERVGVDDPTDGGDPVKATDLERDLLARVTKIRRPFLEPSSAPVDEVFAFDRNGNLRQQRDGKDFATTTTYDQFDRWIERVAPGARPTPPDPTSTASLDSGDTPSVSKAAWDANSNQVRAEDPNGNVTQFSYDALDRQTDITDARGKHRSYGYDAHGNLTCERSPLGWSVGSPTCAAGGSTIERGYDRFDELLSERRHATYTDTPVGETCSANPVPLTCLETSYAYDEHGNQTSVRTRGAQRKDDDSSLYESVLTRVYDGRDQLSRETNGTTGVGAGNRDDRTRVAYEYDLLGNLRRTLNSRALNSQTGDPAHTDNGQATVEQNANRNATVYVTSGDGLLIDRWLPWDDKDRPSPSNENSPPRRYYQHFERDGLGRVERIDAPHVDGDDSTYTTRALYAYYENGAIESSDERDYDPDTGQWDDPRITTYEYDRQGNQTEWELPSANLVTRQYYPNGQLARRHGQKTDRDSTLRHYSYAYDGVGGQKEVRDARVATDSNDDRYTGFTYDALNRLTTVDEKWPQGKDTELAYDDDGNISTRKTDGALSSGFENGKRAEFDYDSAGRERRMRVYRDEVTTPLRTVTRTYWPSSGLRTVRRDGALESRFFDTQGRVVQRVRDPDASPPEKDEYDYDNLGNRAKDEHGTYEYNTRAQLIKWDQDSNASTNNATEYTHNGLGALLTRAKDGLVTNYHSVGDQLRSIDVTEGGYTSGSRYFQYNSATGAMTCANSVSQWGCYGGSSYTYDDFSRVEATNDSGTGQSTRYTYDGLDRRDRDCKNGYGTVDECSSGTGHDFGYIGTSESMSSLQITASETERSFDYSSQGARVGQVTEKSNIITAVRSFVTDPSGTVLGLEDQDGEMDGGTSNNGTVAGRERYAYDPYGDSQDDESSLSDEARENPFRFQGFAYEADSRTYDMQARMYRPDTGRFTTPDRFEDALGDFALQSDPLTQDRYAFGAGNPVNRIEFDGHAPIDGERATQCVNACKGEPTTRNPGSPGPSPDHGPTTTDPGNPTAGIHKSTPGAGTIPVTNDGGGGGGVSTVLGKGATVLSKTASAAGKAVSDQVNEIANAASDTYHDPPTSIGEVFSTNLGGTCAVIQRSCRLGRAISPDKERFDNGKVLGGATVDAVSVAVTGPGGAVKVTVGRGAKALARSLARDGERAATNTGRTSRVAACGLRSFSAPTLVLMADGTKKPIAQIVPGDWVLATDPLTGTQGPRQVTDVWVHPDTFVVLTAGGERITTTEDHPFWSQTDHAWREVQRLESGDALLTAEGQPITVASTQKAGRGQAYNLTVDGLHTYYVGTASILVHNAGCGDVAKGPAPEKAWSTLDRVQAKGSPLPGFKGGGAFANDGRQGTQILPSQGGPYREWDVNPFVKGVNRGQERIVTGIDGTAYFTSNHYKWFTQFSGPGR